MLVIPKEYLGKCTKKTDYTNSTPRKWTKMETDWVMEHIERGFKIKDISDAIGRTETSVRIKLKRESKNRISVRFIYRSRQ